MTADAFVVRMRAHAAAHFPPDEALRVVWPDAVANLVSEYTGGDDGLAYPITIHGEIRGDGSSLDEAQRRLGDALADTLPVIALASNAAIATPLGVAAHGLDLTTAQPFLGYKTPDAWEWFPPGKRRIDTRATLELMTAVAHHSQSALLVRAIESYRRALGHWYPEDRLLAGEFLYIAAETLARALERTDAERQGISRKNLRKSHNLKPAALLRKHLEQIFSGDIDALDALKKASDGFEHGYMSLEKVRDLQKPVLERAFGHIRGAMITATGLADAWKDRLLTEVYSEPRALVPQIVAVHGELAREDPGKPPPDIPGGAVELSWEAARPVASRRPDGEVEITFQYNVTAVELPENTRLAVHGYVMRAAYATKAETP